MEHDTRPRPSEEQTKNASLYLRVLLLLVLATFLAAALPLPWKIAALVLAVATAVVSIVGLVKSVRHGLPGTLRITFIFGIIVGGFFALTALAQMVFWPLTAQYEECTRLAVTQSAQEQCTNEYSEKLLDYNNLFNPQS